MYRIRIRFKKVEYMKFISHLDLVRMMERTLRRAQVPLSFSQGFNPHPKISFATALAIGVSSEGEYMDIEIEEKIDLQGFKEKMNKELPDGIEILQCKYIDMKMKALMSIVDYSTYVIRCPLSYDIEENNMNKAIKDFMEKEEILISKAKKKKGFYKETQMDIKPWIYNITIIDKKISEFVLKMTLTTGSRGNLKPEILVEKIKEVTQLPIILEEIRIHRLDLFTTKDHQLVTPLEITK